MTTATISFEIECAVEGTISPCEPATRDYPGCDAQLDDLAITDIGAVSLVRDAKVILTARNLTWKTTSLLDGIDVGSPEIRKLFDNILRRYQEDAETALFDAQARRAA